MSNLDILYFQTFLSESDPVYIPCNLKAKELCQHRKCLFFQWEPFSYVNIMYAVVEGVKGSSKGVPQWDALGLWLLLLYLFNNVGVTHNKCKLHLYVVSIICRNSLIALQAPCSRADCTPTHLHPPPTQWSPSLHTTTCETFFLSSYFFVLLGGGVGSRVEVPAAGRLLC